MRLLLLGLLAAFVTAEINIGIAFDGPAYFQGAQALIRSVVSTCSAVPQLRFYVLTASHATAIDAWFKEQKYQAKLQVVDLSRTEALLRAQKLTRYRGSGPSRQHQVPASLYRLFFPEFFPTVNRLIYFDADVVVQMDVARLAGLAAIRPIQAIRSANKLRDRLNYCCDGVSKIETLQNASSEPAFFDMPDDTYQEFNNGVLVLDLANLKDFFPLVFKWLEVNAEHGFLDNDQHAWNLAGAKMWSPLPKDIMQNSPDGLWPLAVQHQDPQAYLAKELSSLALIHYGNNPKPWNVRSGTEGLLYDGGIWERHAEPSRPLLTDPLFETFESDGLQVPLTHPGAVERGDESDVKTKRPVDQRIVRMRSCWRLAQARINDSADHQTLRQIRGQSEDEYFGQKGLGLVASCYAHMTDADLAVPGELPASLLEETFSQPASPFSQKQLQILQLAAEPLDQKAKRAKSHLDQLQSIPEPKTRRELIVGFICVAVVGLAFYSLFKRVELAGQGPGTGKKKSAAKMRMKMKRN